MAAGFTPEQLADQIRRIYQSDVTLAESRIERHLEETLGALPSVERIDFVKAVRAQFVDSGPDVPNLKAVQEETLQNIFLLLLGKTVSREDISSAQMLQKLAESLKTIFDTLNDLIRAINMNLLDVCFEEETIRHVIGSELKGEAQAVSLESYLGRIHHAFLTTQQAFKEAAQKMVKEVLHQLDPSQIVSTTERGLKFGPLFKAKLFDLYEEKFALCRRWLESGRFMEEFLREFENNCHKFSSR
jgi:hypothetical protein